MLARDLKSYQNQLKPQAKVISFKPSQPNAGYLLIFLLNAKTKWPAMKKPQDGRPFPTQASMSCTSVHISCLKMHVVANKARTYKRRLVLILRPSACPLHKHPLAPPFYELVHQQCEILQDKPAYVKCKEFGRVPSAELKPNLGFVRVSKARVLNLAGDLICVSTNTLAIKILDTRLSGKQAVC